MSHLTVVSDRLPFFLGSAGEDLWTFTPAVGGLVSAVEPASKRSPLKIAPNAFGTTAHQILLRFQCDETAAALAVHAHQNFFVWF
jgi:hypothetical protein